MLQKCKNEERVATKVIKHHNNLYKASHKALFLFFLQATGWTGITPDTWTIPKDCANPC